LGGRTIGLTDGVPDGLEDGAMDLEVFGVPNGAVLCFANRETVGIPDGIEDGATSWCTSGL
jgi:hypothetical protein